MNAQCKAESECRIGVGINALPLVSRVMRINSMITKQYCDEGTDMVPNAFE